MPRLKNFGMAVGYKSSRIAHHKIFTNVFRILLLLKQRQKNQNREADWMIDEMTKKLLKLPEQIAAIVGKTYAVRGDDFQFSDDEVLIEIRATLEPIDPNIIERNKDKRVIQRWK